MQNMLPLVSLAFIVTFTEKNPKKFHRVFDHFSRTYEVSSNVIHTNEHTKYADCTLHVKFWNFLPMSFCFIMKKGSF